MRRGLTMEAFLRLKKISSLQNVSLEPEYSA